MKEVIIVENLKKSFGKNVVHDGVTFTVYDGEIFVVMGPSGTGKSVLLKQIAGLMKPDSGKDSFFATDKPKKLPPFYFLSLGAIVLMVLMFMWLN